MTKKKASLVEDPDPAVHAVAAETDRIVTTFEASTPPAMTKAEYDAAVAALDAERAALEAAYTTSQFYPHWAYHATEPPQIVHSDAEALALGAGWSATPIDAADVGAPVVTALEPTTVAVGQPSFTLHVIGGGFSGDAVIVFNGYDEPTTVVSATEVTTGVNMDVWLGPSLPLPVRVRNGDGTESNALDFTFTAAAP
jgi:hypothetical protein